MNFENILIVFIKYCFLNCRIEKQSFNWFTTEHGHLIDSCRAINQMAMLNSKSVERHEFTWPRILQPCRARWFLFTFVHSSQWNGRWAASNYRFINATLQVRCQTQFIFCHGNSVQMECCAIFTPPKDVLLVYHDWKWEVTKELTVTITICEFTSLRGTQRADNQKGSQAVILYSFGNVLKLSDILSHFLKYSVSCI